MLDPKVSRAQCCWHQAYQLYFFDQSLEEWRYRRSFLLESAEDWDAEPLRIAITLEHPSCPFLRCSAADLQRLGCCCYHHQVSLSLLGELLIIESTHSSSIIVRYLGIASARHLRHSRCQTCCWCRFPQPIPRACCLRHSESQYQNRCQRHSSYHKSSWRCCCSSTMNCSRYQSLCSFSW